MDATRGWGGASRRHEARPSGRSATRCSLWCRALCSAATSGPCLNGWPYPAGRGPLRARRDGGHDDDLRVQRVLHALPAGLPLDDRGDLAPQRPGPAGDLPRPRPGAADCCRRSPLRAGQAAVGLGRGGAALFSGCCSAEPTALHRRPYPNFVAPVPDRAGPRRAVRAVAWPFGQGRPPAGPLGSSAVLYHQMAGYLAVLLALAAGPFLALPAPARPEKGRRDARSR